MLVENTYHINQDHTKQQQNCSDLDIFQMISSALVTLAKSQQILQCIRQILVTDPTFTPMNLFKYLSNNSTQLSRKNLIAFLDQNNLVANDHQTDQILKKVFARYNINSSNGIQYTSYLNFIYPYNSGVLRELLTNKIKKYSQLQRINKKFRPSESTITAFLLLLEQQIKVQKRIQVQLSDQRFPGKDRLKKALKSIKKASQKSSIAVSQKSQNHISMLQIRNFVKAFIQVQDHLFLDLGRRLGLTKTGNIPIQNIQAALKKIKKTNSQPYVNNTQNIAQNQDYVQGNMNLKIENKYTKQINFKQQLYKELASTLKINQSTKSRTPRAKSANRNVQNNNKNHTPNKKNQIALNTDLSALDSSAYVENSNLRNEKPRQKNLIYIDPYIHRENLKQNNSFSLNPKKSNVNENSSTYLNFKEFIQIFLKAHKQIQKCKSKLASVGHIDYLSLFKTLDNGRGVVDAQSMQKFYTKLSGIPTDYDFQMLINRYAQPEQKWLSYSQFSDIFRYSTSKNDDFAQGNLQSNYGYHEINGVKLHPDCVRLISQIIYLNLDIEHNLKKILRKFTKSDLQFLFSRINIDSQSKGFINYQELKRFLTQELGMNIPMVDLMSLLKRLDKSKNGVVIKEQFLTC